MSIFGPFLTFYVQPAHHHQYQNFDHHHHEDDDDHHPHFVDDDHHPHFVDDHHQHLKIYYLNSQKNHFSNQFHQYIFLC